MTDEDAEIEAQAEAEIGRCIDLLVTRFGRTWFDARVDALGYAKSDDDLDGQSISEIASHAPVVGDEKSDLFFELLGYHPQYGMLMLWELPKQRDERRHFWHLVRGVLDDSDQRLADAITYWLWVDWFEDPRKVAEAWRETTCGAPTELRVERIVESSGPVPWELKASVLRELAAEKRWHPAVYRALQNALFDVYGSTNRDEARVLLEQLDLIDEPPGVRSTLMAYKRLPDGFQNWAHFQSKGGASTWWKWGEDGELHEQPGPFPGP